MLATKTTLPTKLGSLLAARPTIRLVLRYLVATGLLVGLVVAGQLLRQTAAEQRRSDLHVLGIASQQRVISQRIVRAALLVADSEPGPPRAQAARELAELARSWGSLHLALRYGDVSRGIPTSSSAVATMYEELHPKYVGMDQGAHELVNVARMPPAAIATNGYSLDVPVERIVRHERGALEGMDRIVHQLERESSARAARAELWQLMLLAVTLAAFVLQGVFVVLPAIRQMREANRRLAQVQAELVAARQALHPADRAPHRSREAKPASSLPASREVARPRQLQPLSAVA